MHKKSVIILAVAMLAASQALATDPTVLKFRIGAFSTSNGMPSYKNLGLERAEVVKSDEAAYYLVQFTGPVLDAWRDQVVRVGGKVFDYIPNYAHIVKMTPQVKALVEKMPMVQFVGYNQPAFRISPYLLSAPEQFPLDDPGKIMLKILTFEVADAKPVMDRLLAKKDVSYDKHGENIICIWIPTDQAIEIAKEIANYPEVYWVERYGRPSLHNAWSRWINQSLDTTNMKAAADSWKSALTMNTANDSLIMPIYKRGLYGQGQIVGDDDTGMDWDNIYFRDGAGLKPIFDRDTSSVTGRDTLVFGTNAHRKIVAYNVFADTFDNNSSGHGSHTAGSIGADSLGWLTTQASLPRAMGMAPKCRIAFSDLEPSTGGLNTPANIGRIYIWAYNAGARITSSSWGWSGSSTLDYYHTDSRNIDTVAWAHQDLVMFRSAGNGNTSGERVNYPATAKNIVCVGASESGFGSGATTWAVNGTATRNELLDVAEFSSHGPTQEGLRRPTLLGCGGWYIWSVDSDGLLTSNNTGIMTMGGTSMSTPTMAGMGALVRQYLTEGWYPTGTKVAGNAIVAPKGALIKSLMMLATRNFNGAYSCDALANVSSVSQNVPSQGQGWGGVVLDDALYFSGDARKLRVDDAKSFTATGQTYTYTINTGTSVTQPLKIVLVYYDYPSAAPSSDISVNNLNLTVTDGTNTYLGNVFGQPASNGFSITGGAADTINPEEVVWLAPASSKSKANRTFTITVTAATINRGPQPFAITVGGDIVASAGFPQAVEMTSFSAMAVNNVVEVRWRTESEKECDHWLIERSTTEDGNFIEVGKVAGNLTTNEPHQYSYTDASNLQTGIYYYRLAEVDLSGTKTYYGPMLVEFGGKDLPLNYRLEKAYPNPAASGVTIKYALRNTGRTSIKVYNVLGQEIRTLVDGIQPAGYYSLPWDGKDSRGQKAANGVYLYKMTAGEFSATGKVMIIR
ncbi:MAG: S8 family serine peptidase [Candidatus Edwardsbacteria bacterium]|nr:S8 family serine peptidase [Candidatus Edwardsbacteria bacterium]MBU1576879.1 S8 family serine peptidase [Candidatus Edwardsbacteria bacterium]MBU2463160.1 S8 family serine peptidase [Candidatus Edwardsbacteria bacterium]MBU2593459.1 S8 family serine peptidase [Candidatus Edwardsbacteria bacterium]